MKQGGAAWCGARPRQPAFQTEVWSAEACGQEPDSNLSCQTDWRTDGQVDGLRVYGSLRVYGRITVGYKEEQPLPPGHTFRKSHAPHGARP
eukprot:134559-Chlamydomonas_euryale.AAC.1